MESSRSFRGSGGESATTSSHSIDIATDIRASFRSTRLCLRGADLSAWPSPANCSTAVCSSRAADVPRRMDRFRKLWSVTPRGRVRLLSAVARTAPVGLRTVYDTWHDRLAICCSPMSTGGCLAPWPGPAGRRSGSPLRQRFYPRSATRCWERCSAAPRTASDDPHRRHRRPQLEGKR